MNCFCHRNHVCYFALKINVLRNFGAKPIAPGRTVVMTEEQPFELVEVVMFGVQSVAWKEEPVWFERELGVNGYIFRLSCCGGVITERPLVDDTDRLVFYRTDIWRDLYGN